MVWVSYLEDNYALLMEVCVLQKYTESTRDKRELNPFYLEYYFRLDEIFDVFSSYFFTSRNLSLVLVLLNLYLRI